MPSGSQYRPDGFPVIRGRGIDVNSVKNLALGESSMAKAAIGTATPGATRSLIDKAMSVPLLSRDQERDLVRRWHEDSDEGALHELIAAHGRLAVSVASKFRGAAMSLDDLVQQGYVGLLKAAIRFDAARDLRFSTYAIWWVRAEIYDGMLRNWSMVRIGGSATQ